MVHKKFLISNISYKFINNIIVSYYNKNLKLKTIAVITNVNINKIIITPFDINMLQSIKTALEKFSDFFSICTNNSKIIISIPVLTTEKRYFFIKQIKKESERSKIMIRLARKKAYNQTKPITTKYKEQYFIELNKKIESVYNRYIKKIHKITNIKKNEIMIV